MLSIKPKGIYKRVDSEFKNIDSNDDEHLKEFTEGFKQGYLNGTKYSIYSYFERIPKKFEPPKTELWPSGAAPGYLTTPYIYGYFCGFEFSVGPAHKTFEGLFDAEGIRAFLKESLQNYEAAKRSSRRTLSKSSSKTQKVAGQATASKNGKSPTKGNRTVRA
jgi:hypothetical protein